MTTERSAFYAVVQEPDGTEESELVTLEGLTASPGATIELTDGRRITLLEPAGKAEASSPSRRQAA